MRLLYLPSQCFSFRRWDLTAGCFHIIRTFNTTPGMFFRSLQFPFSNQGEVPGIRAHPFHLSVKPRSSESKASHRG